MCCMSHYRSNEENTESMKVEGSGKYSRNFIRNKRNTYVNTFATLMERGNFKHVTSCSVDA